MVLDVKIDQVIAEEIEVKSLQCFFWDTRYISRHQTTCTTKSLGGADGFVPENLNSVFIAFKCQKCSILQQFCGSELQNTRFERQDLMGHLLVTPAEAVSRVSLQPRISLLDPRPDSYQTIMDLSCLLGQFTSFLFLLHIS